MKKITLDRRLVTILAIVFVQMVGSAMILPILPLYAKSEFKLSAQTISLLYSSFFLAQFLAGPYLGRLSDRYGRLPILIISQIGTAVSFAAIGFADSVWVLFAARIFDGITGGNIIVAQAYITDVTPRKQRTEALGYVFAMFGLGFIIGPAAGGFLSGAFGPRIPFYLAALVAALTVLLTWIMLDESLSGEQKAANRAFKKASLSPAEVVRNTPLFMVLLMAFIAQFAMGLVQSTFSLFGDAVLFADQSDAAVLRGMGMLFTVVGVTQFLTQSFLLRPLLKRFGEAALVIVGNTIRLFGMLALAMATSLVGGVLGSLLFPLGLGLMMPSLQGISTRTVEDEVRGGVLGLYQSSVSLSVIFGTALGGVLFEISPYTPYWVGTVLGVVALIPAFIVWNQAQNGLSAQKTAPAPGD